MYSFTRTDEILREAYNAAAVAINRANTEILVAFDSRSEADISAAAVALKQMVREGAPLPSKVLAALEQRSDAQVSAVIAALEKIVEEGAPLPLKDGRKPTKDQQTLLTLHEVAEELVRDIAFRTRAFSLVAKDIEIIRHAILDGVCAHLRSPDYAGRLALEQSEIVPRQRPQQLAA